MKLHHSKHHQTYVNAYNAAEEKLQGSFQGGNLTELIALQTAIKFNGGGKFLFIYLFVYDKSFLFFFFNPKPPNTLMPN